MMTDRSKPAVERVRVLRNERIAAGVGSITLSAPACAATIEPGQFVHLRLGVGSDLILRRPFSVYRAQGEEIEILYQVVGSGTARLTEKLPGDESMDIVGPLGHGWSIPEGTSRALMVAGGLGAAPLGMLAERLAAKGIATTMAQGAPTVERLVGRGLFECIADHCEIATDDGSDGLCGFVTEISAKLLKEEHFDIVYVCGPEPMQRIVALQAAEAGVACQVSLERLMACGIGACLSCVVETVNGPRGACMDGPVFDATTIVSMLATADAGEGIA